MQEQWAACELGCHHSRGETTGTVPGNQSHLFPADEVGQFQATRHAAHWERQHLNSRLLTRLVSPQGIKNRLNAAILKMLAKRAVGRERHNRRKLRSDGIQHEFQNLLGAAHPALLLEKENGSSRRWLDHA